MVYPLAAMAAYYLPVFRESRVFVFCVWNFSFRARNALQAANGDPQAGFLDQPRIAAPVDMNVGHH